MLIVLEGVDGAGKTTLVDKLVDLHRGPSRVIHSGPLKQDPMREYEWRLRDYDRTAFNSLLVADRWHLGELVYGPLYRGQSRLSKAQAEHVELYLDALGALRLVVTDHHATIVRRLRERGEDFLKPDHVGLVWDFYNEISDPWQKVRSTTVSPGAILRLASGRQQQRLHLAKIKSYVGPPQPSAVFVVGTRVEHHGHPRYSAALTPIHSTEEHTHMRSILALRLTQPYGIMSVCDGDSIRSAWPHLGMPKIIPMDKDAADACNLAGVPLSTLKDIT